MAVLETVPFMLCFILWNS